MSKKKLIIIILLLFTAMIFYFKEFWVIDYYLLRARLSSTDGESQRLLDKVKKMSPEIIPILLNKYSRKIGTRDGAMISNIIHSYHTNEIIFYIKETIRDCDDFELEFVSNIILFHYHDENAAAYLKSNIHKVCSECSFLAMQFRFQLAGEGRLPPPVEQEIMIFQNDPNGCSEILLSADFSVKQPEVE